jgi:hypothetical protein
VVAEAVPPPAPAPPPYPISVDVVCPPRQSRWKAFFRLPLSIPVLLFSWLLGSLLYGLAFVMWTAVLVRGRIPRWLFDAVVAANRARARARAYLLLLSDAYPPFDGSHELSYEAVYPERTSRWRLVIWKLISSIPHLFMVQVLNFAALAVLPIAWVAIIFTGRFPQGLHGFIAAVVRWERRVEAYQLSITDEFPPFSLTANAGAAAKSSYVISSILGSLLTGGLVALIVVAIVAGGGKQTEVQVSYADLLAGRVGPAETTVFGMSLAVTLESATDPGDADVPILQAKAGRRFVIFHMRLLETDGSLRLYERDFRLKDSDGKRHDPFLALAAGRTLPETIAEGDRVDVELIFELPDGVTPAELRYHRTGYLTRPIVYKFR